jgi:hypothetical protein
MLARLHHESKNGRTVGISPSMALYRRKRAAGRTRAGAAVRRGGTDGVKRRRRSALPTRVEVREPCGGSLGLGHSAAVTPGRAFRGWSGVLAPDAVPIGVQVEMVVASYSNRAGEARTVPSAAGAVIVARVRVQAAAVIRIAVSPTPGAWRPRPVRGRSAWAGGCALRPPEPHSSAAHLPGADASRDPGLAPRREHPAHSEELTHHLPAAGVAVARTNGDANDGAPSGKGHGDCVDPGPQSPPEARAPADVGPQSPPLRCGELAPRRRESPLVEQEVVPTHEPLRRIVAGDNVRTPSVRWSVEVARAGAPHRTPAVARCLCRLLVGGEALERAREHEHGSVARADHLEADVHTGWVGSVVSTTSLALTSSVNRLAASREPHSTGLSGSTDSGASMPSSRTVVAPPVCSVAARVSPSVTRVTVAFSVSWACAPAGTAADATNTTNSTTVHRAQHTVLRISSPGQWLRSFYSNADLRSGVPKRSSAESSPPVMARPASRGAADLQQCAPSRALKRRR